MTFHAEFQVAGQPKAQPRARAFARRMGDKFVARVFDAGTAESWKQQVAVAAKPHEPTAPLEGPLEVEVAFQLPRPKSRSRRKDPDGPIPCTSKPDCDNLAKAVLDCLTNLAWWHDDAQVVRLVITKHWHAKTGRPGAVITVLETASQLVPSHGAEPLVARSPSATRNHPTADTLTP